MFSNQDVAELKRDVEEYKIPIPKGILEAEALHAAAVDLLADVRSETAPNIEGVDIKNLKATHESLISWPSHMQREEVALKIERSTEAKRLWAWESASPTWLEAFRKPFDDAAALFIKSLNELGGAVNAETAIKSFQHDAHRLLMSSAADLETLGRLRKLLAASAPFDAGRQDIEVLGRVLTLPHLSVVHMTIGKLSNRTPFSIEWWALAAGLEGVTIKWHTPKDQQTLAMLGRG